MSRWSAFLDRVDRAFDRDNEREPNRRTPRMANAARYRFMGATICEPCGTINGCECPVVGESE